MSKLINRIIHFNNKKYLEKNNFCINHLYNRNLIENRVFRV